MIRPPPRSPLFPSPPLSRSPLLPLAPFDRLVQRRPQVRLLYVGPVLDPDQGEYLLGELASRPWARHEGADRKSTRLNSSHSQISYAVFCLKKKKKHSAHTQD